MKHPCGVLLSKNVQKYAFFLDFTRVSEDFS